ncbi:THxN family PEP-CTERM protein [Alteromonas ponticola]|uniref:THxN family PEP-CTERM protein n=1 Tax=Alteromonas aquimaris TaxID=2998417 RepID=A0ABT3PAX8_9ALTE|nr:THxN family PEP-CTERM protein [Alteromonas aquimaris]MCW8109922.1 THxN family PEP-CTERM protein [Alteromonas aquimaris]
MKSIKIIAAAIAVSTSFSSLADPMLIQQWSFTNEAGFFNPEFTRKPANAVNDPTVDGDSADGGTSILSTGALPDNVCWGDAVSTRKGQSCLKINSPVTNESTETWNENGEWVNITDGSAQGNAVTAAIGEDYTHFFKQGTALRHDNFPITGQFLDGVTIVDGIQLQAVMPTGIEVNAPELMFLVDFWETPNGGLDADGTCPFGPAARTPESINEKGCSDIFQMLPASDASTTIAIINRGDDFIDFSVKFKVQGVDAALYHRDYELITRLSGLSVVGESIGFATRENGVNVLNAQFAIRAIDAPEPSTLAIFAASLLALSGFTRRKAK